MTQNLEAERATLGAILLNREAILAVAPWLEPWHFWLPKHTVIYAAALTCMNAGVPPDARILCDELGRQGRLDEVGGLPYLSSLIDATPSSYHIEHYAREVERCARLRRLQTTGERIYQLGSRTGADAAEVEAEALTIVNDLVQQRPDEATVHIALTVEAEIEALGKDDDPYTPTGYADLDAIIGGLFPEDFILLGARPSVGKTAFALSLLYNLSAAEIPVLVFSLEMGRRQLLQRLAAMECGIDVQRLRLRRVPPADMPRLVDAMRRLSNRPIFTNDLGGLTPATLRAQVMRHLQDWPNSIVVIDYLQLMQQRGHSNRQEEVSEISRNIKQLAMSARVPILALSQLSRALEGRAVKVPVLSDLRESGSLEQDADLVMFLHREELYDGTTDKKGVAELHIAKHRNGPLGVVPLRFEAATTRFHTLTYRTPTGYEGTNYDDDNR